MSSSASESDISTSETQRRIMKLEVEVEFLKDMLSKILLKSERIYSDSFRTTEYIEEVKENHEVKMKKLKIRLQSLEHLLVIKNTNRS